MATISILKHRRVALLLILLSGMLVLPVNAQVTRKKMLMSFHKATVYSEAGNTDKAIETLKEIAELAPMFPNTYLRMAEIYDDAGNKESAILMYRKYINMEMDDAKVKEPSVRLRALESELGMEHYEDEEEQQALELFAKYNVMQQAGQTEGKKKGTADKNSGLQLFADSDLERHSDSVVETQHSEDAGEGLTLFSLSALMETSKENVETMSVNVGGGQVEEPISSALSDTETLEEDDDTDSFSSSSAQDEPHVVEEEVTLDDAFLAKAYVDPTDRTAAAISAETQYCEYPLLVYPAKSRLEEYGIKRESTVGINPQNVGSQALSTILSGRWVSSECKKNGRETWILNISQTGNLWQVTLDDESGIYIEDDKDFMDASWKAIKNIWTYDHAMSNQIKELRAKTVKAEITNNELSYIFVTEHQQKPHRAIYTWGRNILEGVADFIPFGGMVSQVGSTLINYVSEKDQQKTYTTRLQFFVKAVTPNVLKCEYVVTEKERSSEGEKDIDNYSKSCYLYKVDDFYDGFDFFSSTEHDALNRKLYALLKKDAETDVAKRYPLAYMHYFGAGTGKSMRKAVHEMQTLAEKGDCDRAKAWLVPVCYNLSMDEKTYSNRYVRKYFHNYADETLSELLLKNYPYAYSLKADALMNDEKSTNQVVPLYEKAASLGDVYALHQLGRIYIEGVVQERNVGKAIEYLTAAAEKGYADSYLELALLYKRGRMVERDYAKYIGYLYDAIDCGSVAALKELSNAYFLGLGVNPDFNVANDIKRNYMKASCEEWKEVLNVYGYNTIL